MCDEKSEISYIKRLHLFYLNLYEMSVISFTINGKKYSIYENEFPVTTSMNTFIRNHAEWTGTKFMCFEGGCGACLVTVKAIHPVTKAQQIYAANSCLKPIYSCDGLEIITVEGIGNATTGYHPVQQRLNRLHGTQCGFCTPGMVVNMYSLLEGHNEQLAVAEIERSLGGNICRCTGYRPILDAFKSFAYDADQSLVDACKDLDLTEMDIEDLSLANASCRTLCPGHIHRRLEMAFQDGRQWFRAVNLNSIFDIFARIPQKRYMLLAGNTAQGVYRLDANLEVFIDVSTVPELHASTLAAKKLTIGGNVSLTETMDIFRKIAKQRGFEYCQLLADHIDQVANVGVRNSGTLAGNLSIKHAHNEFPSDIFTILSGIGATLSIVGMDKFQKDVTLLDYLAMDMQQKIILNVRLPKLNSNHFFRSYKVAIRAQNAHAYVNAAFLLRIQDGLVAGARICFGGINPKFVHACATEALLVSRNLCSSTDLEQIMNGLSNELQPDWVLPDASPEYRKYLALALFYRFILNVCPASTIRPTYLSGGQPTQRPISSGTQTFQTFKEKFPLTKPVDKYEGLLQCSGEAKYINDMATVKGELWAAFVVATKIQSKIAKIDTTEAMAIPGVREFYSAKDIPGKNNFTPVAFLTTLDEEIFVGVDSFVLFHSQPVGIIVADTMALAVEAATKVKILYKSGMESSILSTARSLLNPLIGAEATPPIIPTIKEAYQLNAVDRFRKSEHKRDATTIGLNATKTIKGRFECYGQYHYHMETQTCVCVPSEDGMDVHSATQWVDFTQIAVADCLAVPVNRINMQLRRIGGGYGGKLSRATQIACACAIACHLSKRPIRFVMTMEANMKVVGKRYGLISDYTVAVDDQGHIQQMTNNFSQDYGCSLNEPVLEATTEAFANVYDAARWTVRSEAVLTDAPSNTFCRAPSSLEGIAMVENIMEHVAKAVGRDAMDVRLLHVSPAHPIREISANFLRDIDFKQRQIDCQEFNGKNRWHKRGIAVVPMQWPMAYLGAMPAFVAIYHHDGSVVVTHGGIECGQGINTKAAQVAAYALGIPLEMVSVRTMSNVVSANATWTAGSTGSEMICFSIKKACDELLTRMKPIRDSMAPNYKWADLTRECHQKFVDLRATYQNREADFSSYPVYGMAAAEMEVDILTGVYQLRRVDLLEDVGESMSPNVDVGQVEGAFIMGMGYWLSEELVYDRMTGELLTDRSWTYKPPGALDIPVDFRINFLQNSPNPSAGVLRSKAVGEPASCMAIVVLFALRNALYSARTDAGLRDEWFPLGSACTPEQVFLNSGNSIKSFTL